MEMGRWAEWREAVDLIAGLILRNLLMFLEEEIRIE